MSQKKPKYRTRLFFLYLFSFIVSCAPIIICLIVNFDKYTKTPGDSVKLCFGGVIALIFVFLKVVGKLKIPSRIVLFGIIFLMSYLLEAVLDDMLLLSGMALLGEVVDALFFRGAIKRTKEAMHIGKTADATAGQVEEIIKKYLGGV